MDEHALRSLKDARGPCPGGEDLVAYEALDADERARHPIDPHVQICSRCQLVLLHLDDESVRRPGLSAPAIAAADAGVRTWSVRIVLPLAALLALAIGASYFYRAAAPPPPDTIRGTEIQPIAPAGAVTGLPTFEWQSPIQAAKYRVTVRRGSDTIWMLESETTRLVPPASAHLPPGEYSWQVEALDREGVVRMSSPPQRFVVR
jgi:hypothetical protein